MTVSQMKKTLQQEAGKKERELPRVIFVASECAPLAKTGGLADVVGALPRFLNKLGFDARVILPYHRVIKEKYGSQVEYLFSFQIDMGWRKRFVGMNRLDLDGVCIWLVENDEYFGGAIYQDGRECEQYGYFTRAVLEALPRLDFLPDVVHCNDWHTGLIPLLLKTQYAGGPLGGAKTLFTIHNIAYQGVCDFDFTADWLGIPSQFNDCMERFGHADFMKAGCVAADRVNTVSPGYAREICTPEFGEGLETILSRRGDTLCGIVNGIDRTLWDPANDELLPARYSAKDLSGKAACRETLAEAFGLDGAERPILGMVTRLAEQKGIQLLIDATEELMEHEDFSLVVLGSGERGYEDWLQWVMRRRPGRIGAYIGYSDSLSHLVYAGSDFFLMPSRFEPCGISQMIAMRYGTPPIVRRTGGLADTVAPFDRETGKGDGFCFSAYDGGAFADAIRAALQTWNDKNAMGKLLQSAMAKDFGCETWAYAYGRLYLDML